MIYVFTLWAFVVLTAILGRCFTEWVIRSKQIIPKPVKPAETLAKANSDLNLAMRLAREIEDPEISNAMIAEAEIKHRQKLAEIMSQ